MLPALPLTTCCLIGAAAAAIGTGGGTGTITAAGAIPPTTSSSSLSTRSIISLSDMVMTCFRFVMRCFVLRSMNYGWYCLLFCFVFTVLTATPTSFSASTKDEMVVVACLAGQLLRGTVGPLYNRH